MKIVAYQLETVLTQLKNFTEQKGIRPVLSGIHLAYEDGVLTVEATDSYIMSTYKIEVEPDAYDENVDMTIVPFTFKAGNTPIVELNLKEMYVKDFATGRKTAINIASEEEYPNLARCFPKDEVKATFSVRVDNLLKAIKGLKKDDVLNFEYRNEVKPLTVHTDKNSEMFKENGILISVCRKR